MTKPIDDLKQAKVKRAGCSAKRDGTEMTQCVITSRNHWEKSKR